MAGQDIFHSKLIPALYCPLCRQTVPCDGEVLRPHWDASKSSHLAMYRCDGTGKTPADIQRWMHGER